MLTVFKKIFLRFKNKGTYLFGPRLSDIFLTKHHPDDNIYIIDPYILNKVVAWTRDNPTGYYIKLFDKPADIYHNRKSFNISFTDYYAERSLREILDRCKPKPKYIAKYWFVRQDISNLNTEACVYKLFRSITKINDLIGVNEWYLNDNINMSVTDFGILHHSVITTTVEVYNKDTHTYLQLVAPELFSD